MYSVSDITTNSAAAALTSGSGSSEKSSASNSQTTKDQFLKMLVAQLQNQDPLTPPDATQFANQMTSFGQLEQLFNINNTLGNLANAGSANSRFDAVSMIGKKVEAIGDQVEVGSGPSEIAFQLPNPANDVMVRLKDSTGAIVRTIHYNQQQAGIHHFDFDGKNGQGQDLAAGTYQMEVSAVNPQGEAVAVDPMMVGTVTGVDFASGGMQLFVGTRVLAMEQILSVRS